MTIRWYSAIGLLAAVLVGSTATVLIPAGVSAQCCSCDSVEGLFCDTSGPPGGSCGAGDSDFLCDPLGPGVCVGDVCVPPPSSTPTVTSTSTPTATQTPTPTQTATATPMNQGLGEPCSDPGQCASTFCAQGVCCDQQCAAPFEACDRTGSVGRCSRATAVPAMSSNGLAIAVLLMSAAGIVQLVRRRVTR